MKLERIVAAVLVGLILFVAVAAQSGVLNPVATTGSLFGSIAGIDVPDLDDPAMIRRGAGHYDRVCAGCHASPDRPDQADALDLNPPPPKLHLRIEGWPPEFLFRTVKHGVRNTAMPAWPAQSRDDEVWAMVAFLVVLPTLDVAAYRELVGLGLIDKAAPPAAVQCIGCHGPAGRGSDDGAFPRLDIQGEAYILAALEAFRGGRRESGIMQSAVDGLKDEELGALAAYFAGEPALLQDAPPPLIANGDAARGIPACGACHGPPQPPRGSFPHLGGQYEAYLNTQLRLFRSGHRGGGPFARLMEDAARELTDEDIESVSRWYGSVDAGTD
jgi:cytochrome c553